MLSSDVHDATITDDSHYRALLSSYDKPGPRYTSYPTAIQFTEAFGPDDYVRVLNASDRDDPVSIYLHLPFCDERCLFCACNTIISPDHDRVDWYVETLLREIETVAGHLRHTRHAAQFHLGGGTPTYFSPPQLERILGSVLSHFPVQPGAELSIEVDPRVTSDAHLELLARFGFNRLSLGVQDLDPVVQQAIHRIQPMEQTRHVIDKGRELGMHSVNIDLIYGLPHQNATSFERTLDEVVELRPDRLAIYSFAFLPSLKGHQRKLDRGAMPDRDGRYDLVGTARRVLGAAGYIDIGMDHFALPTDELTIAQREGRLGRNFMGYTVHRAPDILAFGTSSIGFFEGSYIQNTKKLNTYREAVEGGTLPVERGLTMTRDDKIRKAVIDDIMCNFHVDKTAVAAAWDIDFDAYFDRELNTLSSMVDDGLVQLTDTAIDMTPLGKHFVRNAAMHFDIYNRTSNGEAPRFSRTV